MTLMRDHKGKLSMMRAGAIYCMVVGSILTFAGTVAAFMSLSDAGTLITTGSGLMASSGWAKAIQSKWERSDE